MPEPADSRGPGASEQAGPSPKEAVDILLVDDTPSKLLALESALAPLRENLVRATSGRDALRHLLARDFATIILDVNMPGLDGFETARMIRSRPRSAGTPIIFTSAVNMDEADTHRGYGLGAVDYMCAPIVPEVLRAKIAVFVELHRKSQEAKLQARRLEERSRELELSQRELRMSERMASLGTLCAGLGHDMGNLLLPVSVWIDSVDANGLPPDLREGVDNLKTCVQYLRKLAGGLRLLALDPARDAGDEQTDLAQWSEEMAPVLRNAMPRGISLDLRIEAPLPAVRIAPHRLAQVMLNLVQNAGEVLRDTPGGQVRIWAMKKNAGVRLGVTDNGPGMSKDVLERCLDPFFTTKTRGISTGLGLSLVHSIIRSADAQLELESTPGHGTTFAFELPIADRPRPATVPVLVTVDDPRKRAISIALVQAAGGRVVSSLPTTHAGPAAWLTDTIAKPSEQAELFTGNDSSRRVFLLSDEPVECPGVQSVPLTGREGLAATLRQFLSCPVPPPLASTI